jgi:hypothetical protein
LINVKSVAAPVVEIFNNSTIKGQNETHRICYFNHTYLLRYPGFGNRSSKSGA